MTEKMTVEARRREYDSAMCNLQFSEGGRALSAMELGSGGTPWRCGRIEPTGHIVRDVGIDGE